MKLKAHKIGCGCSFVSGIKTDINRDIIAKNASGIGFQPVAMFAIDETWAALRLKIK